MAIKALASGVRPGSMAARFQAAQKAAAPKAAVPKISVPKNPVGYTGSGWNYPTSSGVMKTSPLPTPAPPSSLIIPGQSPVSGVPGNPSRATATVPDNFSNYFADLQNDPVYMAGVANDTAATQAALNTRKSDVGRYGVAGGYDLGAKLTGDLAAMAGDWTPDVAAAAAANQLSTRAQIDQVFNRGLQNNVYQQAGRGTLNSGATATGATGLTEQAQLQHNTAMNQILDQMRGAQNTSLDAISRSHQGLQQTANEVAARLAQLQYGGAYDIGGLTPEEEAVQNQINVPGTNIQSAATRPPVKRPAPRPVAKAAPAKQVIQDAFGIKRVVAAPAKKKGK